MLFGSRRAYLDENLDPSGPVAEYLRGLEFDVIAVSGDGKRARRRDEFHYRSAREMGRLLVTRDLDFLRQRFSLGESPGVIVLHSQTEDQALELLKRFATLWRETPIRRTAGAGPFGARAVVAADGYRIERLQDGETLTVEGCFFPA